MKEIIVKLSTLSNLDQLQIWQLEFEIRKLYTGRVAGIGYDSNYYNSLYVQKVHYTLNNDPIEIYTISLLWVGLRDYHLLRLRGFPE